MASPSPVFVKAFYHNTFKNSGNFQEKTLGQLPKTNYLSNHNTLVIVS